jgi:hypothetical protein
MIEHHSSLDRQLSTFIALRGYTNPSEDYWEILREMMSEINHLRMVIKYPRTGRQRGRQPTAEINRERYQDLLGFLAFKHSINGEEAAQILSELSVPIDVEKHSAKTILELASGWKTMHFLAEQSSLPIPERWKMHEEWRASCIQTLLRCR